MEPVPVLGLENEQSVVVDNPSATLTNKPQENDYISYDEDQNVTSVITCQTSCGNNESISILSARKADLSDGATTSQAKESAALKPDGPCEPSLKEQITKNTKENNEEPVPSTSKSFDEESLSSKSDTLTQKSLESNIRNNKYYNQYPLASSSKQLDSEMDQFKRKKVELYAPDVGPRMYNIKGNLVTPPIIAKNLPEIFSYLPTSGKPNSKNDMEKFYSDKIREFVGFDLNDKQFENLDKFCSPDHLKTGKELVMSTPYPTLSVLSVFDQREYDDEDSKLCIVKKHQLHSAHDPSNYYQKRLKYRGIRLMPLSQIEPEDGKELPMDLEPGKDIIYRVRIYRPFPYNLKEKLIKLPRDSVNKVCSRHSVFSRDVILLGRSRLSALRDRLVCANDAGMRVDGIHPPAASAKDLFPSGFLFINNVFYVDARGACQDRSAPLRAWARARGLGDFPKQDLHSTRLDELNIRLGHPEVYVHQGNCEHLFTFSEIRLLGADDPLSSTQYPCHTAVSQNQTVYCTTCAEFAARWVVVGCPTVPFDPAYFCDTCLKMYLYKDDKKLGDFKCYSYRGNEINMLKPQG